MIAAVVFFIGWVVAELAGNLSRRLINLLKVDQLLAVLGIKQVFKHSGINLHIANTVGVIVKWLIIGVFLVAITDIFGLRQVADFLTKVTDYLPNVIAAAVILIIGLVVANALGEVAVKFAKVYNFAAPQLVGALARWSILVFSFLAILVQLKIAASLVQTLFTGIVAALALAFGLAFGLGGKELASRILNRLIRELGPKSNE